MVNLRQASKLLGTSFMISFIIFITAIASDLSVKMFYSSADPYSQIITGLVAILLIMPLVAIILCMVPEFRKTFGID